MVEWLTRRTSNLKIANRMSSNPVRDKPLFPWARNQWILISNFHIIINRVIEICPMWIIYLFFHLLMCMTRCLLILSMSLIIMSNNVHLLLFLKYLLMASRTFISKVISENRCSVYFKLNVNQKSIILYPILKHYLLFCVKYMYYNPFKWNSCVLLHDSYTIEQIL